MKLSDFLIGLTKEKLSKFLSNKKFIMLSGVATKQVWHQHKNKNAVTFVFDKSNREITTLVLLQFLATKKRVMVVVKILLRKKF